MITKTYTKADEKPFIVEVLDDNNEVIETINVIAPDFTFAIFEAHDVSEFPYNTMRAIAL